MNAALALVAIGVLAAQSAAAPSLPDATKAVATVQLKVSADDDLRAPVRKALEGALAATAGLRLVETTPDFTISVIVLKVVNRSRRDVGVVFSVLVTAPLAKTTALDFKDLGDKSEQWKGVLDQGVKHVAHWVQTAPSDELAATCRSIAEAFAKELQAFTAKDKSGVRGSGAR